MSDFKIDENGVLEKYKGKGGDVVIPEGVTSIGDKAFWGCFSPTSITIPESVTSIGYWAFWGCFSLTSITIPESVTSIGWSAFKDCSSLTSITIPESVTSIGESAFEYCSSLTSITIPDSVTSIVGGAFQGCSSLTSITIPEGVKSIGPSAFYDCSSLTSITIPESVTSIGYRVFSGCSSLKSITIPEGVKSIGERAFSGCSSLKSITIPDSVKSIGNDAFYECSQLKHLTIQGHATVIGEGAFSECKKLRNIQTQTKLTKPMFEHRGPYSKSYTKLTKPLITNDPAMLLNDMKPLAAIGFAQHPDDPKSERGKAHLKYLKSNAAKLVKEAMKYPALLALLCEQKLIKPEAMETFLAAAQEQKTPEATAMLLDYQQNKLTAKEKQKAADKAEAREEKVTDFVFSAAAIEQLTGKTFVVTGKLTTMTREEFKACLDACGATLSETLNAQTSYLITNTPDSGSAKNKKAEQLGVKKLTENEFRRLIGME